MWGTLRHYKIVTDLEDRKCMKRVIFVREEKYMEDYTGLCFPDINYLETAFGCKMIPLTLDACQQARNMPLPTSYDIFTTRLESP